MKNMEAKKIIRKPDFIGTLRQIEAGEVQKFKMTGTTYSAMRVAALRLNKRKEGEWKIEIDHAGNELIVTRLA